MCVDRLSCFFFFFNDTATTEIYTLSLHDALPISAGRGLLERLEGAGVDCSGVVVAPELKTTTKVRILAGHAHSTRQQVVRLDYENDLLRDEEILADIAANVGAALEEAEAAVVSDYNYGGACETTVAPLRDVERRAPVVIDSRFRVREFAGFDSATPNEDEVEQVAGRRFFDDADELAAEGERLRSELGYRALLVTRGKHGMLLLEDGAR